MHCLRALAPLGWKGVGRKVGKWLRHVIPAAPFQGFLGRFQKCLGYGPTLGPVCSGTGCSGLPRTEFFLLPLLLLLFPLLLLLFPGRGWLCYTRKYREHRRLGCQPCLPALCPLPASTSQGLERSARTGNTPSSEVPAPGDGRGVGRVLPL